MLRMALVADAVMWGSVECSQLIKAVGQGRKCVCVNANMCECILYMCVCRLAAEWTLA